jgi:hypothetical protein
MSASFRRFLLVATLAMPLIGCESSSPIGKMFETSSAGAPDPAVTGSVGATVATTPGGVPVSGPIGGATLAGATGLTGDLPTDPVSVGKRHYREGHFGLAEQAFRKAVEEGPRDAEAWVGLAASYDRLRRFDLADRAYSQALKLAGPTAVILNNQGYSYLLRGELAKARSRLAAARAADPENPTILANVELLETSRALGKDVR